MTAYTITVTDGLGAIANYSFEVVENPVAPAVPDFIEVINLEGAIAFGGSVSVVEPILVFGELGFRGLVTAATPETVSVEGAIGFTGAIEVATGGGGGGASKVISNISTASDLITFVGDDFTWPNGTVVRWSTTGTLPTSSPQVEEGVNYLLYQYFEPTYYMLRESDFTEIDFFPGGSGTHTLTEQ